MDITIGSPTGDIWPVEVGEAKEYLQIDHNSDDDYIRVLIQSATRAAEHYTGRLFIERSVTAWLDASEARSPLTIPHAPYRSLTSFEYYDEDNTATAVDSNLYYVVGTDPARFVAKNSGWLLLRLYGAIKIVYKAGYGLAASAVPQDIRHAIKMIVADMWDHTGHASSEILVASPIPFTAKVLLNPYRLLI